MMGSCKLVYTVVYGHDMCHGASCVSTASNRHGTEEWVGWIVTSQFNDFDSPLHKSHSLLCQSTYCSTEERERERGVGGEEVRLAVDASEETLQYSQ